MSEHLKDLSYKDMIGIVRKQLKLIGNFLDVVEGQLVDEEPSKEAEK